eukprot:jgi/Picsp_1/96/NSC_00096-R1_glycosyl group 1
MGSFRGRKKGASEQQMGTKTTQSKQQLRIAFCHPDLGLGGAERLVIDAAAELSNRGHDVDMYTAYYDPQRCFEETKSGLFRVIVKGSWFPRSIGGRAMALCAYIRCIIMAYAICMSSWFGRGEKYDVVIVDQVAVAVVALRLFCSSKVLFYCHFPDLLLASPKSKLHKLYRAPLDAVEEWSTGMADHVLVNSKFTRGVFGQTFQSLNASGIVPDVLHPAVSIPSEKSINKMLKQWKKCLPEEVVHLVDERAVFLSINRFERKKNIGLAIKALGVLHQMLRDTETVTYKLPGLVVAGGYDVRLTENVEHLQELEFLVGELGLGQHVVFMPSFTDEQRLALLVACQAVIYTPENEHFGIVPIESMATGTPVIACNSGGPKESIETGQTGYLVDPDPDSFADAMEKCLDTEWVSTLGKNARKRTLDIFSRTSFGNTLDAIIQTLVRPKSD